MQVKGELSEQHLCVPHPLAEPGGLPQSAVAQAGTLPGLPAIDFTVYSRCDLWPVRLVADLMVVGAEAASSLLALARLDLCTEYQRIYCTTRSQL